MEEKFEIRDLRNGEWAWVHKTIIEYEGFKSSTKLVYLALAYLANQKSQSCYPSISYLKRLTRLSKPTIIRGLQELEQVKVLRIERRIGQHSIYTLLKTDQLNNLTGKKYDRPVKNMTAPVKNKTTNNNKEQELNNNKDIVVAEQGSASPLRKEINELIEKFKPINPSYERLFSNTTQRGALERLLKKMGRQKLEQVLDILPSIFGKAYAPRITTPYALEQKLADLFAYLKEMSEIGGRVFTIKPTKK